MIVLGSLILSPAHGTGGARANIKNTIARLLCPPKADLGWEAFPKDPALLKKGWMPKPAKIKSFLPR